MVQVGAQIVLTTCENIEAARLLATKLLEARLAACINVIPNVSSFYIWEGKPVEESEVYLFIKTSAQLLPVLLARLKDLHPYKVPFISSLETKHTDPRYLSWMESVIGDASRN